MMRVKGQMTVKGQRSKVKGGVRERACIFLSVALYLFFLSPLTFDLLPLLAAESRSIWGKRGQAYEAARSDNPWNIQLSSQEGYIIEYAAPKLAPLVCHIQDAHANPPAQTNISKILRQLVEKYQVRLVCVEGADGDFDDSLFDIQNSTLKERVVRYFLNEARLTGAEYEWLLHLDPGANHKTSFTLWGIEDNSLYTDHWNVWEKTQSKQEQLTRLAEQILKNVQSQQGGHVSKPLLQYEQTAEAFRQGVSSLKDYIKEVIPLIEENQLDLAIYPEVQKLIQVYQGALSGALSLGLSSTEELDRLEQEIRVKLAKTPEEKEYVQQSRLAGLFVRFVKLELTPAEWKEYQEKYADWEAYVQKEHQVNLEDLQPFRRFYELANRRDQVLFENAFSKMKELGLQRMVLIAGGFHSYGITDQLRNRQLPYMVIAPKVEAPTNPGTYAKAMYGEPLTIEEIQRVVEKVQ